MLTIEGLEKTYRTGDPALRGVSLSVGTGEIIGLIGPSGAGKSTLIRCVNRLVEPNGGKVFLGETEITSLGQRDLRRVRRHIGMIFQEFALVVKAFALLDRVGLTEHVDKRADALSGGQRQRIGIARALIQGPKLLLVDEPTASLDPKTSRQVMRLLIEVCVERGLAAIVNIHDVGLAQMFLRRIVGLRAGAVVYDGPAEGLSADVLTTIYGEEDWTKTAARDDDDHVGPGDLTLEAERRITAGAA